MSASASRVYYTISCDTLWNARPIRDCHLMLIRRNRMSKIYILFFLLGFMLDKVRLLPFVLGLVVGLCVKAFVDARHLDTWGDSAKEALRQFPSMGKGVVP
jgi:hypothetical protein